MSEAKTITRFPAGVVRLPPSKSLSHRAVICAALAAAQASGRAGHAAPGQVLFSARGAQGGAPHGGGTASPAAQAPGGAFGLGNTPLPAQHSVLRNLGDSQDIRATMACAEKLYGITFARQGDDTVEARCVRPREHGITIVSAFGAPVEAQRAPPQENTAPLGPAGEHNPPPQARQTQDNAKGERPAADNLLDCAESGSTLRFFIPLAAMTGQPWRFCGRGRLMQRPQEVYRDIFAQAGAIFEQQHGEITVQGPLPAGSYRLQGDVSSQFLTGLLLALPLARGDSRLVLTSPLESAAYVDLTLDVMRAFGLSAVRNGTGGYHIPGSQSFHAADYTVEGDWSQAAFFLGAGALGRPVACAGLAENSRQGDAAVRDILSRMGARVGCEGGLWRAHAGRLAAADIDAREIPDLVPPLAALCCFADGESHITGAARLRLKESDRLAALASQLRRLGANIRETDDGLAIRGQKNLRGGTADAVGDHRIAMALALAAIRCSGPVSITGWQSVKKSYPAFWLDFEQEEQHE